MSENARRVQSSRIKETTLSQLSMSITWFSNRSLLKVYGDVGRSAAPEFARTLSEATSFSAAPVVVDLRDVDSMHPRVVSLLVDALMSTANRNGPRLELLVKAPGDQFEQIIGEP
jgi:anti-anti-sigma regulatory factor